jgi:ABC-type transporter Mla maintaining outer membrane lipid asymmetry ATPase subunit MlaF
MSDILATVESGNNNIAVSVVGIQGPSGQATTVSSISDVDAVAPDNGSVLVFKSNTSKWTATRLLDLQVMEGGEF